MRNNIPLSDEQIEAVFKHYFGAFDVTVDDLVFTRDTIDDFQTSRQKWREGGVTRKYFQYPRAHLRRLDAQTPPDAIKALIEIGSARLRKGQPRTDLCIVDFGEVRACFNY